LKAALICTEVVHMEEGPLGPALEAKRTKSGADAGA